ncbi:MAG TPA: hypothetical protein VFM01_04655 [Nakamurella sp.]|nr:hypothetical protein [Nakamurella sp.]
MSAAAITALSVVGAAIITALSVYAVARVGRKTGQESQGVQALSESVDGFRDLLIETRKEHERRLTDLQQQITGLARDKDSLAARVNHLELALAAARQYINALLSALRGAGIDPPDPPDNYAD